MGTQTTLAAFPAFTGKTAQESATIVMDGSVNLVDVYFDAGTYGTGADNIRAQFSVDGGTVWHDVPNTLRTSGTDHVMSFVAYGNRVRLLLTDAGSSVPDSAVIAQVFTTPVSMSSDVRTGAIATTATNYAATYSRVPEQLCLVVQAGTWDTLDARLQGSPDGATWYDLNATVLEANGFVLYDNPGKLKNFRVETINQDAGTLTAFYWVFAAEQSEQVRSRKLRPSAQAATATVFTDSTGGTADTTDPKTLVAISATYVEAEIENNFATVAANVDQLIADVETLRDAMEAAGALYARSS